MATLQASLLSKPSLPFPFPFPFSFLSPNHSSFSLSFHSTRRLSSTLLCCTFRADSVSSWSESNDNPSEHGPGSTLPEPDTSADIIYSTEEGAVLVSDSGEVSLEGGDTVQRSGADLESEVNIANGRFSIMVLIVGLWVKARERVKKALAEFLDWWPFWRHEKRLERLIAEADANPQDAAKQSALFVELNKHRYVFEIGNVI